MRLIRSFAILAVLAACDSSTEPPRDLPPLANQVWQAADISGQPLPRIVAQRTLEGDTLEYDILDHLFVTVTAEGAWTQRAYLRRFRDGELHAALQVEAQGTWAAEPSGYLFVTNEAELGFLVPEAIEDSFTAAMWIAGVTAGLEVRMVKTLN